MGALIKVPSMSACWLPLVLVTPASLLTRSATLAALHTCYMQLQSLLAEKGIPVPYWLYMMGKCKLTAACSGTWELGHKGHLYRNVAAAVRRVRGSDAFDIVPRAYLMPRDYEDFKQDLARHPGRLYIQKVTSFSPQLPVQEGLGLGYMQGLWLDTCMHAIDDKPAARPGCFLMHCSPCVT